MKKLRKFSPKIFKTKSTVPNSERKRVVSRGSICGGIDSGDSDDSEDYGKSRLTKYRKMV
jgi:hypothetical protein